MKLLHIDASILGDNSASRRISAAVVDGLRKNTPGLDVTYRDLAAEPPAHLSGAHLLAGQGIMPETPALQADIANSQLILDEFLASDVVVIGVPMYNFAIPSQLKAWLDRILIAGKTFRYGPNGPEGLAGSKRVILAMSRGGLYGPGMPAASAEHQESYLRSVFAFIGVTDLRIVLAEGLMMGPEPREQAMAHALHAVTNLTDVSRAA